MIGGGAEGQSSTRHCNDDGGRFPFSSSLGRSTSALTHAESDNVTNLRLTQKAIGCARAAVTIRVVPSAQGLRLCNLYSARPSDIPKSYCVPTKV